MDKLAAISQTIFSDAFSLMKTFAFFIKILQKFVPGDQIDKNPLLI